MRVVLCSNVFWEADELYMDKFYMKKVTLYQRARSWCCYGSRYFTRGQKFGDVKEAGRGWVGEDYNWDNELQKVFGEVDADLKKELTDYFTSDMKAKYLVFQKGEQMTSRYKRNTDELSVLKNDMSFSSRYGA